jgi:sulfatase modifying factor 1
VHRVVDFVRPTAAMIRRAAPIEPLIEAARQLPNAVRSSVREELQDVGEAIAMKMNRSGSTMKRIQLGLAIVVAAGTVLFGASYPEGSAVAAPADGPPSLVEPAASVAANILPKTPLVSLQAAAPNSPLDVGTGNCAPGMVEVEGDYCTNVGEQKCLRWLDPDVKMRCAEFEPTGPCVGRTVHKKFCIDRFEYPNIPGERPVVMKTWYEAKATCEGQGKRLCGESEWTLACEGQERLPYPYGLARDAEACNIDKPHPDVDEKAIANPATRDAEVARLDQRDPSGFRDNCVSAYGVHDMTGNVDEWVVNESGKPYQSGLKGGYWGPVRTRCRPSTIAHNEQFMFYQIGFRCCSETPSGTAPSKGPAAPLGPGSSSKPSANPMTNHAPVLTGS